MIPRGAKQWIGQVACTEALAHRTVMALRPRFILAERLVLIEGEGEITAIDLITCLRFIDTQARIGTASCSTCVGLPPR